MNIYRHIKLPRKRKKNCLKFIKRGDYMMVRILNEILIEEGNERAHDKFPILKVRNNKVITLGYY